MIPGKIGRVNASDKGTQTEAVILSELAKVGYTVLVPFGPARYDLAIDGRDGGGIKTVQCKTGRIRGGCIIWDACSQHPVTQVRANYRGQVDYFGVWCPEAGEHVYLVPVEMVGIREGSLRVDPLKSKAPKSTGYRWAKDFQVSLEQPGDCGFEPRTEHAVHGPIV
jgi:hypothetical protein